jgi:hypothetical protein
LDSRTKALGSREAGSNVNFCTCVFHSSPVKKAKPCSGVQVLILEWSKWNPAQWTLTSEQRIPSTLTGGQKTGRPEGGKRRRKHRIFRCISPIDRTLTKASAPFTRNLPLIMIWNQFDPIQITRRYPFFMLL